MQAGFYALALLSIYVCFHGFHRRYRLWQTGKPVDQKIDWPERLEQLYDQVFKHERIRRRPYAGVFHAALFCGLSALFVGTVIVGIEHYGALVFGAHWLYRGWFYLACKVTLDLFGLLVIAGAALALIRRMSSSRPKAMGGSGIDFAFLSLLIVSTVTGYLLEGAGIAADPSRTLYAPFSPVGRWVAASLHTLTPSQYVALWWIHIPLVLSVIAILPYGRWLHLFVIPLTVLKQPSRRMGVLSTIDMAEVEETGKIGIGSLADLDRWQLMSLDGCMECGRCTAACPANAAGKELDPQKIVLDLRNLLTSTGSASASASTDIITDDVLWACTNCHACVRECPALIRHVDIIDGIRRFRVAEGRLKGSAATMLRQLGSRENPWGLPASQRSDWSRELNIPPAAADDGREILFWVGCSGAFDPAGQRTVQATAKLFQLAGVKFSILGPKERCSGDPARRSGDEFLFQQLAESNVSTLESVGAKTIVTQCPHCLHSIKNEYPQFGGNYEVMHHSEYLAMLQQTGRLKITQKSDDTITYHDPCFLARVNGVTEAPRELLGLSSTVSLEEPKNNKSKTFCCGAGGGRMWMEDQPQQRPGLIRANELLKTGARTVAVGCPFCRVMIGDSLAATGADALPKVMDIAEILLASVSASDADVQIEENS